MRSTCVLTVKGTTLPHNLIDSELVEVKAYENIAELLKVATQCRVDIFHLINNQAPQSLYELAKLLDKNQAYVYREVQVLRRLGLVDLADQKQQGRKRIRPVALFKNLLIYL